MFLLILVIYSKKIKIGVNSDITKSHFVLSFSTLAIYIQKIVMPGAGTC
jgi:hypothetical protein